jgi:murein DD-endopeptidase MepM/ murein hydrolase activator NlpD
MPPLRAVAPKPAARPAPKPAPRPPARPTPQPAMRATAYEPLPPPPQIVFQAPIAAIPPSPRVVYSSPAMASQPALAARVATAEILMPPPLEPPLQPPMFELPKLQPLKADPVRVAHDPPGKARQRRRRSFSSPFVESTKPSRAAARWERPLSIEQRRPQPLFRVGLVAIAVAGLLALWRLGREEAKMLPTAAVAASRPTPEPPVIKPPAAPPLDGVAGDLWIHPLAGPERRMPERDSRLFGAERVGDRPSECRGGHCGVDLAGAYGEPVYAVHDGVVDRVQRALNPDHGGRYVRLAHRDGTIITQYFHLSAIPRGIVEGAAVKAGEVVGFVGLTGVKRSEPHLHFTIEVQDPSGREARYLDPEPLVALWPLRVSSKGDDRLHVSTAPPGLARGFLRHRHRHHAAAEAD